MTLSWEGGTAMSVKFAEFLCTLSAFARMRLCRSFGENIAPVPYFRRLSVEAYRVARIEEKARTTDLSIGQIHHEFDNRISRSQVGKMVKRVRNPL